MKPLLYSGFAKPLKISMVFEKHPHHIGRKKDQNVHMCVCVYGAPKGFANPLLYRGFAKPSLYRGVAKSFNAPRGFAKHPLYQ